ncbi:hypothetical protein [Arenimonas alkanexedens]
MNMAMKHFLIGFVLLAAAPAVAAVAAVPAMPAAAEGVVDFSGCYQIGRVVDPELSPDAVAGEMKALRAAAERGGMRAAYVLGTLYRLGPSHPAKRLPHDPALADRWLRQAAMAGDLNAMAGLAENALSMGRVREGLILALAQTHYLMKHPSPEHRKVGLYTQHLVSRGFAALGEPRTEQLETELLAELNDFVATHGEAIAAGILGLPEREPATAPAPSCPGAEPYDRERWPLEIRAVSSVLARSRRDEDAPPHFTMFHIVVSPDGRVARALPIDFSPGPGLLKPIQRAVEGMRFNEIKGAPPRVALLPFSMQ